MPGDDFRIDDLRNDAFDSTQSRVVEIYSRTRLYAVYRTPARAVVQYSDSTSVADEQRRRVVPLNNLRTQINGLINGWRASRIKPFRSRARRYDSRVAAILVMALDGDLITPAGALTSLWDEITEERVSWGRFEYLISAFIIGFIIFWLLTLIQHVIWPFNLSRENLWLAGRAGALGAFFSIALGIRNRTVLTNLHRRDNVTDAGLRVIIGVIAAGFLILLLGSKLLKGVTFAGVNWSGKALDWQKVLGLGFVAGFSERLVPDLLARYDGRLAAGRAAANQPVHVVGQPTTPPGPKDGAGPDGAATEPSHMATARDAAQKAAASQQRALTVAAQGAPDAAAAHAAASQVSAAQAGSSGRR